MITTKKYAHNSIAYLNDMWKIVSIKNCIKTAHTG